jgi:hypothetical protein
MPFEVISLLSPVEMDRAIDRCIQDVRKLEELPLWSIDQKHEYSIGPEVIDVSDAYYFSDPTHSLDKGQRGLNWFGIVKTATGQELRIEPSLPASYQIIMKAVLEATLGAGDLATVNLPSDEPVLWGATSRCYWLVEQRSPGQEAIRYKELRREAAHAYTTLAQRFTPKITRRIQLDQPW